MLDRNLLTFGFRAYTRRATARFYPQNDRAVQIRAALQKAARNPYDSNDLEWFDRIENIRKILVASKQNIAFVDYGGGLIWNNYSDAQMQSGRPVSQYIGRICRRSSTYVYYSRVLFNIIRKLKPTLCLELGTCVGISASDQAAALHLNRQGRLITLEGAAAIARIAEQNFKVLGLDNVQVIVGRFQDKLERVLENNRPIDLAFIDGHHVFQATVNYFQTILPYMAASGVIIVDDINWWHGMRKAWRVISTAPQVEQAIDLW